MYEPHEEEEPNVALDGTIAIVASGMRTATLRRLLDAGLRIVPWRGDGPLPSCVVVAHEPPAFDALAWLASLTRTNGAPPMAVIAVTASADRPLRRALLRAGAMEILTWDDGLEAERLNTAIVEARERYALLERPRCQPAQATREKRKLLQIIEHSNDLVGTANLDGRITSLNAAGRRLFGLSADEDPIAWRITDFVPDEWRSFYWNTVATAVRERGFWSGELQLRNVATGELHDVFTSSFLLRDPDTGEPWCFGTVTRDITEQKAAATALAKADEHQRAVLTATDIGLWHWDAQRDEVRGDANFLRLWGFESTKEVGPVADFMERIHPDDRPRVEAAVAGVLEHGGRYDAVFRVVHRDGSVRWLHGRGLVNRNTDGTELSFPGVVLDVTDRFETTERLRESDERYRALLASIDEGYCIVEVLFDETGTRAVDYRFLEYNPSFEGQTGLVDARGKTVLTMVPKLDASWMETYGRVALTGEAVHFSRFDAALGRWFEVQALRDGAPEQRRVAILFRDVTARHTADEALRHSEERWRRIFDTNMLGILFWDLSGRVEDANDEFLRIVGYDRADLDAGRIHWAQMTPPEYRSVHDRLTDELHRTGKHAPVEKECIRKDGTRVWVMIGSAITDGTKVVGFVLDYARQKRTEAALRESEARFRALADHIAQLAWMADETGDIVWYNHRWFEYTGTTDGEMRALGWQRVVHPDHLARVNEKLRRHLASGEPWEDTFLMRSATGEYRWFLSRAIPILDDEGKVVRWFGTNTDVTAQREAEETLREADRKKDEFIAILAHELRNPLAPLRLAVQLLRRNGPAEPRIARAQDVIDRQVTHMARLIDDLLDVSRITRGKLALQRETCDVVAIARETAEDYRASLENAGLTLVVAQTSGPVWVDGDPVRLAQMVGNLLHNAGRFTEKGGRVEVRTAIDLPNRLALVEVSDTGVGIEPALLSRLFDPFSQADQDLARSKGGLGLGLALTRGLAELHGGGVAAHSEGRGRGATFTLRIPLSKSRYETKGARAAVGAARAGTGLRVLVVEDNRDAAETLGELLELTGHEVALAFDGSSAIVLAQELRPDVVISDLGLPGELDGYAVARRLRDEPGLESVHLIALSGYANEEARRRALDAGFDAHIAKPPDIATLERTLAAVPRRIG